MLNMPTNYTASMSISNLITPTSFKYQGTELSTTLATYLPFAGGTMTGSSFHNKRWRKLYNSY